MTISIEQIEAVAPDQASLNAASKLLKRAKWPMLEQNADGSVLWGQCQGSGSTPYGIAVATHDLGAKCSCPSRKFPCKHSIALMWWFAENAQEFSTAETPDWVSQWLSRRRGSSVSDDDSNADAKPKVSAANAKTGGAEKKQSAEQQQKKQERAAKQKQKNREAREASISQGLDELDLWIADQIAEGLAAFEARAHDHGSILVKRLVDAKAPGLAVRVENMIARYFGKAFSQRGDYLIEQLGMLHLLANAYRKQDELPSGLKADVRQAIGWTVEREQLLNDSSARRVSGEWLVTGIREESQTDRMLRIETWLLKTDGDNQESAVLIDFVPVSSSAGRASIYTPGQRVKGTLVFYPASVPMRALLVDSEPMNDKAPGELPAGGVSAGEAARYFLDKRVSNPWLEQCPMLISGVTIKRTSDDDFWVTCDSDNTAGFAIDASVHAGVSVLLGLQDVTLYALFDGHRIAPLAASTSLGPWWGVSA